MNAAQIIDLDAFRRKRDERLQPQAMTPSVVWCWVWVWPSPYLQR